jgi:hypothetical protein
MTRANILGLQVFPVAVDVHSVRCHDGLMYSSSTKARTFAGWVVVVVLSCRASQPPKPLSSGFANIRDCSLHHASPPSRSQAGTAHHAEDRRVRFELFFFH